MSISQTSANPSDSSFSLGFESAGELERVFTRFDANGDGRISADELAGVMRALGSEVSPEEIATMMAEMDADGDGSVDLAEFAAFHRRRSSGEQERGEEADLKDAFEMYDMDRNGLISSKELHQVLSRLGEKCSVQDCSKMIRSVDSDGDGSVSFEEFKRMMSRGGAGQKEEVSAADLDPSPSPSPSPSAN